MKRASWLALLAALILGGGLDAAEIKSLLDIRSLTPAEAREKIPVKLTATVIYVEGQKGSVFLQDATAGTYAHPALETNVRPGDVVEVTGETGFGLYLPGLDRATFRVVSHGPMPPASPATYSDLLSGRYHYQRVAVEGIVHTVSSADEGRTRLQIALGPNMLEVRVQAPPDNIPPLVDSRVRVEALAAGAINNRHQLVQPALWLPDWASLHVLEPAPTVEAAPVLSATELLAFRVEGQGGHRVRVSGTVVATLPDGSACVRDGLAAVRVHLVSPTPLSIGDQIEAAGFPEMRRFSAALGDAVLLRQTPGPPPDPAPVTAGVFLDGSHDNDLVQLQATLTGAFPSEDGTLLALQIKGRTLRAIVPAKNMEVVAGSQVRATGICMVEASQEGGLRSKASAVSLRLRSEADLAILQSPPWWTPQRLAFALIATASAFLVAGLWIAILRRQVHHQTEALRGRIELEAVLEERHRLAREFHDTLEQGLAGLSLRLDAMATREIDDKGRMLLRATRGLVSQIQAETRNLVSDLRDAVGPGAGSIASALEALADRHPHECQTKLQLEIPAQLPTLPSRAIHHLRMIAQEAITNALKHAHAQLIRLRLEWTNSNLIMTISDDGCGFDVSAPFRSKAGHFGCVGITERGEKLGAEVRWHSEQGRGTLLEVILPCKPLVLADA